jgi:hypothetical protein
MKRIFGIRWLGRSKGCSYAQKAFSHFGTHQSRNTGCAAQENSPLHDAAPPPRGSICEATTKLADRSSESSWGPKHASWLNMVEIEIGVLRGQCINRRIGELKQLVSQIAAWEKNRNEAGAASGGYSP